MTIDLIRKRIYHIDENRNLKEHFAFCTNFSHFEILNDGRVLVMENYYGYENLGNSNLYCINQNLEIEWFVQPEKKGERIDQFVGFTTKGNKIYANTWDCFRMELNIENGTIVNKEFTK